MTVWAIDNNGDWIVNNNIFPSLNGNFEIIQNVETRLREQINDCFFNLPAGIDWLNLPKTQIGINDLIADVKNIVSATNGVTAVIDIDAIFNNDTRSLMINLSYKTIYSDLEVSQLLFDL